MKNTLIFSLLLLIFSCSTDNNKMIVSGEIEGLKKGTLYLQEIQDSIIVSIDSMIIDGKSDFLLEARIDEPDIYYLYLDKNDGESLNDIITFFGNIGEININTRLQTFDSGYEISGSKNSKLLGEYLSVKRKFNFQNLDLLEIFYKAQAENSQKIIDSVNSQIENLIKRKYLYSLNFAINNSEYEISPYIAVSEIADANTDLLNKLYDTLPKKIKNSKYGKILEGLVKN
mgnify:CR=1 FL=1|tara:strand:- start:3734 stop:4420 length:687 start_codon:yes stop_codon:yes gene_type:complete